MNQAHAFVLAKAAEIAGLADFTWRSSSRKGIAEHRQAAARLLPRGLVLDDVPVLREHAILHAHDVSDDPRRRLADTAEPPMENDKITRRRPHVSGTLAQSFIGKTIGWAATDQLLAYKVLLSIAVCCVQKRSASIPLIHATPAATIRYHSLHG